MCRGGDGLPPNFLTRVFSKRCLGSRGRCGGSTGGSARRQRPHFSVLHLGPSERLPPGFRAHEKIHISSLPQIGWQNLPQVGFFMKYLAFIAQVTPWSLSVLSPLSQGWEGWFFTCPAVFAAPESLFPPTFKLGICGLSPAAFKPFASPVVGIWDNEGTVIYLTIFNQNYSNLVVVSPGSGQPSKESPWCPVCTIPYCQWCVRGVTTAPDKLRPCHVVMGFYLNIFKADLKSRTILLLIVVFDT